MKRLRQFLTLVLLHILFFSSLGFAQDALIEVQSSVDSSEIFIGDPIHYSIIITHDKNLRVEQPAEGLHLGAFEIKEYHFLDPVEQGDQLIKRYDFIISVFDTGSYSIPAFPIAYFPDTTNQYRIIEAAAIKINVKSVLSGEDAPELKDIKDPFEIPLDYVLFWIIAAIVLTLLIIGYFVYRAWKRKQETGFAFKAPPKARPAHELALEALQNLYNSDLLEKGENKQFYSQITEILRTYLEGRYFIAAMEETTEEIIRHLKNRSEMENVNHLKQILVLSDLVKFAKHKPESAQTEDAKSASLKFVDDTKLNN